MIQRKKKQLKVVILILLAIAILASGIYGISTILSKNDDKQYSNAEAKDLERFKLKTLIVESDTEPTETYNAKHVEPLVEDLLYVLEYNTVEETKNAYYKFEEDNNIKSVSINSDEYTINKTDPRVFTWNMGDTPSPVANWGPYAMGLNDMQTLINRKSSLDEIVVAVVDTGFNVDHLIFTKEPTLKDRIKETYNAVTKTTDVTDSEGGHGSNVGGIVLEATPDNVKILPIKVASTDGTMYTTNVIQGIDYAIAQNVDVINISLGADQKVPAEEAVIKKAIDAGITVVVAAGNDAQNMDEKGVYPACYDNVITVGSVKTSKLAGYDYQSFDMLISNYEQYIKTGVTDLSISDFSNYGSKIDFVTPGDPIIGLSDKSSSLSCMGGTSQASPHLAAAVATILSYNNEYTNEEIYDILKKYSYDLGDSGKDIYYGNGFVNFKEFAECTCGSDECDKIYCLGCENTECIYHPGKTKKLKSIAITQQPTKIQYTVGEKVKVEGMKVTATYSDGSQEEVDNYTYTPNDAATLTKNDTQIVVEYTEDNVTRKATQNITVGESIILGTLKGIEITTPPNKVEYKVGETFDPTGMVVSGIYDDGSESTSKSIINDYEWYPTDGTDEMRVTKEFQEDDVGVIISYEEESTLQAITITKEAIEPTEIELSNIEITTPPNKLVYEEGETFDPTGMVVTAEYSDDSKTIIEQNRYSIFPVGVLSAGTTKVTVSYTEKGTTKTADQAITVNAKAPIEKVLSSIMATTMPTKTTYIEGERFDPIGMVITATYSDGTTKVVTDYTYAPTEALTINDQKVTVIYSENKKAVTVDIPITVKVQNTQPSPGVNPDPGGNSGSGGSQNPGTNPSPGLGGNMSQTEQPGNTPNNGGLTVTDDDKGNDKTTSDDELAYTGSEFIIIPSGMAILALGITSFIQIKKYKGV